MSKIIKGEAKNLTIYENSVFLAKTIEKLCFVSNHMVTILKFVTGNAELKEFLQKLVFIFEESKFSIFRQITIYP